MKKLLIIFVGLSVVVFGQCLSSPISTRVGIKLGFNPGSYDPGNSGDSFSGTGMHVGFGMGTDFVSLISIDMVPQFRTTNYSRDELLGTRTYSYKNLYFPILVSLKGGMIPLVSPYLGLGIGINIQFEGIDRFEFNNGTAVEDKIEGSSTSGFLILGIGAEIKLTKLRISPEFTANLQPKDSDTSPQTTDYHISVGVFYSP